MKTIRMGEQPEEQLNPCVATIGFFDGVHCGHKYLIKRVVDEASVSGMESTVITFDCHPRMVLQSDYIPELLTTLDSKLLLLSRTDIDNAVVLHFDKQMAQLSAYDFMRDVLRDKLNVRKLIIGYDNRFGCGRTDDFQDYQRYGKELGIEVIENPSFVMDGVNVSSTIVRKMLQDGEIENANKCLGYPYTIVGKVTSGFHEGRRLGFPTANLDISGFQQLLPASGVYAVKARVEGTMTMRQAMMNIGTRPTFDGEQKSVETHIFDFSEDIYGKILFLSFMHKLRQEQKFDSEEDLINQLREDKIMVREQFNKEIEE